MVTMAVRLAYIVLLGLGSSKAWFMTLPDEFIKTTYQFANIFIDHFTTSRRCRKTSHHLLMNKYKENESLQAYIANFLNGARKNSIRIQTFHFFYLKIKPLV